MSTHFSLIVIGAGAGGLVVAIGAAKAGKQVLLIENGNYGGDCTNFGCIPSKSLIASAQVAHVVKRSQAYGIKFNLSGFNADGALVRTREIVQEIRRNEEPESLAKKHVETRTGVASFVDSKTLRIELTNGGVEEVTGDNIVIATGSHPYIPSIPGLMNTPFLTNETIFNLEKIPDSLIVMGGGPIGCELGQAFSRLGSKVSIIQHGSQLLAKEEGEAAQLIQAAFNREGISTFLDHEVENVAYVDQRFALALKGKGQTSIKIEGTHLLISTGRKANTESLNLDAAKIKKNQKGIEVDTCGRTSQPHIWAVGDVAGRALFTHMAENEARSVLTNLILPWPFKKKEDWKQAIPRVTYTDPEVASVGLNENEAKQKYGAKKIASYYVPFTEVDRAITTGHTEGFVKIVTFKWSSKILGATIAGPRSGEMLPEITLAMQSGIPLRKLAALIHPYPTYSLAIRKAADQWLTKTILPSLLKWVGR